jgi:hypothetical protein
MLEAKADYQFVFHLHSYKMKLDYTIVRKMYRNNNSKEKCIITTIQKKNDTSQHFVNHRDEYVNHKFVFP